MTRLQAGQSLVQIPVWATHFSPLYNVNTGSAAHPVSYCMVTVVLSRGRSGRVVKLTTPSSDAIQNEWIYMPARRGWRKFYPIAY
jgi:hypothetical protein